MRRALRTMLERRVDASSLAVFRIAFGALMFVAIVRFAAMGWIDELLIRPEFHFTYWGFSWIRVMPPWSAVSTRVTSGRLNVCR